MLGSGLTNLGTKIQRDFGGFQNSPHTKITRRSSQLRSETEKGKKHATIVPKHLKEKRNKEKKK